jgi:beta-xylosidase
MKATTPIYPHYFADPFLWRHGDEYFAIGTGAQESVGTRSPGERIFPLLRSRDFIRWESAGKALEPPDPALGTNFWAPEIAYHDGRFWMYYSVGHGDKEHQIRVASSTDPLGPYRDVREEALVAPTDPPFAIDPHPFRNDDGTWYLFYSRDCLDTGAPPGSVQAGTVLAMDRLIAMDQTAGEERIILRARNGWQRFMKDRPMYGGIYDWHTLEGPFVRKHNGKYYCFYSGGRWEDESYGVDYAVAEHVTGPYSDEGSELGPRVLKTIPGKMIGPGHNSVITAANEVDYLAYHAWDPGMTARQVCVTPIQWGPDGPRCAG